ncbi:peroxidase N1-like [Prunus yedoensis var. nudiflora]|uniref:peroxidase n=1 Tax=Prunus yedoensis var. nudiflora TaxID=2094558 RepID=A0A315B6I5_PRUYE|nr:peroxidase N1-like [Prunus yedoensis var. nudiflora]
MALTQPSTLSSFLNCNHFALKMVTLPGNSRGILESDQKLWTDASTKSFVQRFLGVRGLQALNFNLEFGRSMVKMSNIGTKSATNGEIRRICSAIN